MQADGEIQQPRNRKASKFQRGASSLFSSAKDFVQTKVKSPTAPTKGQDVLLDAGGRPSRTLSPAEAMKVLAHSLHSSPPEGRAGFVYALRLFSEQLKPEEKLNLCAGTFRSLSSPDQSVLMELLVGMGKENRAHTNSSAHANANANAGGTEPAVLEVKCLDTGAQKRMSRVNSDLGRAAGAVAPKPSHLKHLNHSQQQLLQDRLKTSKGNRSRPNSLEGSKPSPTPSPTLATRSLADLERVAAKASPAATTTGDESATGGVGVDAAAGEAIAEEATAVEATAVEAIAEEATAVEATAGEAIAEEATAVEATAGEAIAEEATAVEATAVEAIAEEATAVEATAVEAIAEEATAVEATAVEAIAEEATAVEATAEEATAVEAIAEEATAEEASAAGASPGASGDTPAPESARAAAGGTERTAVPEAEAAPPEAPLVKSRSDPGRSSSVDSPRSRDGSEAGGERQKELEFFRAMKVRSRAATGAEGGGCTCAHDRPEGRTWQGG
jgi:hypothetical protein